MTNLEVFELRNVEISPECLRRLLQNNASTLQHLKLHDLGNEQTESFAWRLLHSLPRLSELAAGPSSATSAAGFVSALASLPHLESLVFVVERLATIQKIGPMSHCNVSYFELDLGKSIGMFMELGFSMWADEVSSGCLCQFLLIQRQFTTFLGNSIKNFPALLSFTIACQYLVNYTLGRGCLAESEMVKRATQAVSSCWSVSLKDVIVYEDPDGFSVTL